MSNRLTFSLASLVLIIGLSLVVVPVEAADVNLSGDITAQGFAVVASAEASIPEAATDIEVTLPDLEDELSQSALYTLIAPVSSMRAGTDGEAIAGRDVVISEIMWGIDGGDTPFADRTDEQYIELYNTVADADTADTTLDPIDLGSWIIHTEIGEGIFYRKGQGTKVFLAAPGGTLTTDPGIAIAAADAADADKLEYIVVDQVGNVEVVGPWVSDIGQSGSTTAGDDAKDLISMYRNINYSRVEGTSDRWKDFPNGTKKGSWKLSKRSYDTRLVGSPGAKHFVGLSVSAVDGIAHKPIIINEIGNLTDDNNDWLELRNVSDGEVNLKKWQIGEIAGDPGSETTLVQFPDNDKHKIPAGGILLIVNDDPHRDDDHPLAAGTRINDPKNLDTNPTATRYYVAGDNFKLKNTGKTLLVVRSGNDKKNTHEKIVDLTGTNFKADDGKNTEIWPLRGRRKGGDDWGHGDVVKGADEDFRAQFVYQRKNAGRGVGKETWERRGYTGIGYKRSADNEPEHGGTPGFGNGSLKEKATDLADGAMVTISEIMYQTERNAPQWIELHNTSSTQGVNLNGWKLKIETDPDDDDVDIRTPSVTITFSGPVIPPNQTVLIVSTTGQASDGIDEDQRIIHLWGIAGIKEDLEIDSRRFQLLSTSAFKLTLMQKDAKATDTPVDVAGNLGADPAWELPMMDEDADGRSSIIRRYDAGVPRAGTMPAWSGAGSLGDASGEGSAGWVLTSMTGLPYETTYYGHRDDISTPGFHGSGALPVSLSKFRPERLDSGAIVVRWVTESELNNAGFNILRSETKDGEFTKLNTKLIAGQGTTSERTTYEYADTSAKPNVVYYYQIQDVSLEGQVNTLATTHLRGNVTAAGKLTTIWGEIKALQ